ncbi:MAG: hypothetical protein ACOYMW_00035 [Candidatus Competibacteraceae bacterium]
MNEAKARHSGMLHQSRTLSSKVMLPDAVDRRTLRLNDFTSPGEMAFTAQAGASNRNVLGMTQKCPLNKNGGDGIKRPLDVRFGATTHRLMAGAEKQALHHDLNQRGRHTSMYSFEESR